ncbi:hypothetical protein SCHPADRAFT_943508 [Schizopora paradoxa]|uniref:Uncharacterized protein n=1 Tax=Schizopora paradoxa TaxID=27342 RepID=A0A0H2RXS9_9AGAM|nr:hypothetical protein SCHPADRAFT_943508 [Schizopora paradoxa]
MPHIRPFCFSSSRPLHASTLRTSLCSLALCEVAAPPAPPIPARPVKDALRLNELRPDEVDWMLRRPVVSSTARRSANSERKIALKMSALATPTTSALGEAKEMDAADCVCFTGKHPIGNAASVDDADDAREDQKSSASMRGT